MFLLLLYRYSGCFLSAMSCFNAVTRLKEVTNNSINWRENGMICGMVYGMAPSKHVPKDTYLI